MGNDIAPVAPEKLIDHSLRQEANGRAQADPFPGPLADAFCKDAIKCGTLSIRKFVARDFRTLKTLEHPVLEMIRDFQQTGGTTTVEFDEDALITLAYLLTINPKDAWALAQKGREPFKAAAEEALLDVAASPAEFTVLGGCAMEQLKRAWATPIKYVQEIEKDGEVTFFRDAARAMETASAGGSTTVGGS